MVIADFIDVLASLHAAGARYVVTGGAAVVLHGGVREIVDLDLIVDPTPAECVGVSNALARAGFFPTIPLPLAQTVVLTFVDLRGRRVDVHVQNLISYAELSKRCIRVTVDDVAVPLIALHDLIEIKQRMRPGDPDIGPLLALAGVR